MTTVLEGRRIIVTGAATGVGAAAVEVLAAAGPKWLRRITVQS